MEILNPWVKRDLWGSLHLIPEFLGHQPDGAPWSELWYGTHTDGPTAVGEGRSLSDVIAADPNGALGEELTYAFGPQLPYLVKVIAPQQPLSLQVHPTKEVAREGYLREELLGVERTASRRVYRDLNHKPEMVYALTDFEALVGFRVPRKARRILEGLEGELAENLRRRLQFSTVRGGLRSLVSWLFDPDSPVTQESIAEFVDASARRLESGTSPSVRTDRLIARLANLFPGDPGIIVAFLMNPVSLRPGECVYIPPRVIHSYGSGLGIEVMASSDNVIRAGLTAKFVDAPQLVEIAEFAALPAVRVAPEHPTESTDRFLVPAQEFELSITTVSGQAARVPGSGARIAIVLGGELTLTTEYPSSRFASGSALRGLSERSETKPGESPSSLRLSRGQAVFVAASEGSVYVEGTGRLAQSATP